MRKSWLYGVVVVLTVGYSFVALAGETIPIGVGGPFTGPYAAFGEQLWRGAEQAAQDINAAGGIDGKKIELFKGDDACEPKQALAVANQLVERHGVKAVIGHFCSSSTIPASEVYAEAGILQITPGSTNPMVTERGIKTLFRTCGRDNQQGSVGAQFVVNALHAQAVAIVHDKDTYGQGLANAMRDELHRLGKKEVLYEGLTRGEKDFNALVTKFKSVNADAVYFGGLHNEAGPLIHQMKDQGLKATLVSGDGIVSQDFVVAAGGPSYAEGVHMTFGRDPRKIKEGHDVVERMRKMGYEPEGYTLYSYATLQVIAAAITATKKTDGATLANWLHSHDVPTVMGSKGWDAKGDLKVSDYVMYRWHGKGGYEEVP
ncbi:MAG: branched-chain amino acid ABC transporter substrate-binding protein [Magnetococcales bacterium]|nr:branched-chain amino acid ABC transporter substrate-binding protein [Magnetococcales bacterium]